MSPGSPCITHDSLGPAKKAAGMSPARFMVRIAVSLLYNHAQVDGLIRFPDAVGSCRSRTADGNGVRTRRRSWSVHRLAHRTGGTGVEARVPSVSNGDAVHSSGQG